MHYSPVMLSHLSESPYYSAIKTAVTLLVGAFGFQAIKYLLDVLTYRYSKTPNVIITEFDLSYPKFYIRSDADAPVHEIVPTVFQMSTGAILQLLPIDLLPARMSRLYLYEAIGMEIDPAFFSLAESAIPKLAALYPSMNGETLGIPDMNSERDDKNLNKQPLLFKTFEQEPSLVVG